MAGILVLLEYAINEMHLRKQFDNDFGNITNGVLLLTIFPTFEAFVLLVPVTVTSKPDFALFLTDSMLVRDYVLHSLLNCLIKYIIHL